MKRKTFIILPIIFFVIVIGVIIINVMIGKTSIAQDNATLSFIYADKDINVELTSEESKILKSIFDNKKLYYDSPSCGFSKDVSVKFGDLIFCIACDTCGTIKLENENKYFSVSTTEREQIEQIFEKYGGHFPCV